MAGACIRVRHHRPTGRPLAWSDEQLIASGREWQRRHGRLPRSADWSTPKARAKGGDHQLRLREPPTGAVRWPPASTINETFGSWARFRECCAPTPSSAPGPSCRSDACPNRRPPRTTRTWRIRHRRAPPPAMVARSDTEQRTRARVRALGSRDRSRGSSGIRRSARPHSRNRSRARSVATADYPRHHPADVRGRTHGRHARRRRPTDPLRRLCRQTRCRIRGLATRRSDGLR